jgi:hypothetical protein
VFDCPGAFKSVDEAWGRLREGDWLRCDLCRRREACGLLDGRPACIECVEYGWFGEAAGVGLVEELEREERGL